MDVIARLHVHRSVHHYEPCPQRMYEQLHEYEPCPIALAVAVLIDPAARRFGAPRSSASLVLYGSPNKLPATSSACVLNPRFISQVASYGVAMKTYRPPQAEIARHVIHTRLEPSFDQLNSFL